MDRESGVQSAVTVCGTASMKVGYLIRVSGSFISSVVREFVELLRLVDPGVFRVAIKCDRCTVGKDRGALRCNPGKC